MRYAFLLLALATIAACKRDPEIPAGPYMIFGDYYGECMSDCIHLYKLDGGNLYEYAEMEYTDVKGPVNGPFTKRSVEDYERVKNIQDAIPKQLLEDTNRVLGQPDAGDWGGLYLETKVDGQVRYWYIDKMQSNLPEYIRPFSARLDSTLNTLR